MNTRCMNIIVTYEKTMRIFTLKKVAFSIWLPCTNTIAHFKIVLYFTNKIIESLKIANKSNTFMNMKTYLQHTITIQHNNILCTTT